MRVIFRARGPTDGRVDIDIDGWRPDVEKIIDAIKSFMEKEKWRGIE
jgi:hypothetical protein